MKYKEILNKLIFGNPYSYMFITHEKKEYFNSIKIELVFTKGEGKYVSGVYSKETQVLITKYVSKEFINSEELREDMIKEALNHLFIRGLNLGF